MLILKQAKIKRLEKKTDGGENRGEIGFLVLSRRAFMRRGAAAALGAYYVMNSPVTALAQAAGFGENDLNKVVIYVMDIFRVEVDGKESERIPSPGEYVLKALEEGNVLGSKKRESPKIIKANVGIEVINSKGAGKPVSQYEYYSGTQYYGVLGEIYEYVKANPFKKIIVVIGSPHSDKSAQEVEFFNELISRGYRCSWNGQ